jgi:hypothetical protein
MLRGKLATKASELIGVPSKNGRSIPLPQTQGAALCSNEFGQNKTVARLLAPILSERYAPKVRATVDRVPALIAIKKAVPRDLMLGLHTTV